MPVGLALKSQAQRLQMHTITANLELIGLEFLLRHSLTEAILSS